MYMYDLQLKVYENNLFQSTQLYNCMVLSCNGLVDILSCPGDGGGALALTSHLLGDINEPRDKHQLYE